MYEGYSFFKQNQRKNGDLVYKCSNTKRKGCKVTVAVNVDNEVISSGGVHNHEPIKYMQTNSGVYIKI